MGQGFPPPLAELALVRNDQGGAEVVQRLPFIELAEEAAAILRMGIPMPNVERACQPSILLECTGQGILLRMGLELLHEERRRHPAELHRTRSPQHLVPPIENPWAVDATGHMRLKPRIALGDPVAYGQKTALRPLAVYRRKRLRSSTGL